ncbi:M15 family metallopeptidase [Streptomyces sp. NPDC029041]|uniref:M15 family metallopeptidase n=1 Tax=Streptomyces sp. NPDC029041 TaxID=3155727 RepID=UPI0033CF92AA
MIAAVAALLASTTPAPAAPAATDPKAPKDFVALSSGDPTLLQEMRCVTPHDFVGERVDGYRQPLCVLTRPAAEALHKAQRKLLHQGCTTRSRTATAPSARFPDNSIDMGTGFDCFDDTLSHTSDPHIQGRQRANRLLLKNTLEGLGFVNPPEEWWHYTFKPEAHPDTYFDFPVSRTSLSGAH